MVVVAIIRRKLLGRCIWDRTLLGVVLLMEEVVVLLLMELDDCPWVWTLVLLILRCRCDIFCRLVVGF